MPSFLPPYLHGPLLLFSCLQGLHAQFLAPPAHPFPNSTGQYMHLEVLLPLLPLCYQECYHYVLPKYPTDQFEAQVAEEVCRWRSEVAGLNRSPKPYQLLHFEVCWPLLRMKCCQSRNQFMATMQVVFKVRGDQRLFAIVFLCSADLVFLGGLPSNY